MGDTNLGPVLDELGVTMDLDENERITEVLVIAKTTDLEDGSVSLMVSSNDLDWIQQWGLHAAANQVYMLGRPMQINGDD